MLSIFVCLIGVLLILGISEILWRKKKLRQEYHRKFVHMGVGLFVAFWPWLISWRAIQLIGLAMAIVVVVDREVRFFKIDRRITRQTFGDLFFALAISLSALLTTNKYFFMIAILHVAVADGLAAIIGQKYGRKWRYKVFGETRSVVGTMAFWLSSLIILGIGLLFVLQPDIYTYAVLLLALPPILSVLENMSILGLDNVVVSMAVLAILRTVY